VTDLLVDAVTTAWFGKVLNTNYNLELHTTAASMPQSLPTCAEFASACAMAVAASASLFSEFSSLYTRQQR